MLDKRAFLREFGMIAERFNRTISEPVALRYFDTLSRSLSTDDFVRAARHVFDHDQYWPAPSRFIELAHGDPKANADAEWQRALEACARNDVSLPGLTEAGRVAFRAAGGWHAIAYAEGERTQAARKREFVTAYLAAREERSMTLGGLPAPHPELPS